MPKLLMFHFETNCMIFSKNMKKQSLQESRESIDKHLDIINKMNFNFKFYTYTCNNISNLWSMVTTSKYDEK